MKPHCGYACYYSPQGVGKEEERRGEEFTEHSPCLRARDDPCGNGQRNGTGRASSSQPASLALSLRTAAVPLGKCAPLRFVIIFYPPSELTDPRTTGERCAASCEVGLTARVSCLAGRPTLLVGKALFGTELLRCRHCRHYLRRTYGVVCRSTTLVRVCGMPPQLYCTPAYLFLNCSVAETAENSPRVESNACGSLREKASKLGSSAAQMCRPMKALTRGQFWDIKFLFFGVLQFFFSFFARVNSL